MDAAKFPVDALQVGQRVSRRDSDELGNVVSTTGHVKVKWDCGATSYFRWGKHANVRLKEQE